MKKSDFYYDLPQELIAQTPSAQRDHSRLLVYTRANRSVQHKSFFEVGQFLHPGDLLVVNETRVIPARLLGQRSGGGTCEVLLLKRINDATWEAIVRPGRRMCKGEQLSFGEGRLTAQIDEVLPDGNRIVTFTYTGVFEEVLDAVGLMPLPPYITAYNNPQRYQTVYANQNGSAAAPTAGLHFTQELLQTLQNQGVGLAKVLLHVGLGTFRPVKEDDLENHKMHSEYYELTKTAAEQINTAKRNGNRVIAVGTTSCRVIETLGANGQVTPGSGWTDIFIKPGYEFEILDGLITNFHLPESTLLMLISALMGKDEVLRVYAEAIAQQYRFFSFGDAMLIL